MKRFFRALVAISLLLPNVQAMAASSVYTPPSATRVVAAPNFTAAWRLPGGADSYVAGGDSSNRTSFFKIKTDALPVRMRLHVYNKEGNNCVSAVPVNAGSGYAVNDVITIAGGTLAYGNTPCTFKVTAVSTGAISTVSQLNGGGYATLPANPASQASTTGSGTGATFTITYSLPSSNWGFTAAPTETNDRTTQNNRYAPIVGATAYNVAWSASVPYGWRTGTFGGAANAGLLPFGSTGRPAELVSDWIELNGVPRADGGSGYLTMIRVHHDASQFGTNDLISGGFSNNSWQNASAQTFFKDYIAQSTSNDGVNTLTNMPTVDYETQDYMHWVAFEFDFATPVRSVLAVGTSITTGGGGQIYSFDNWSARGILDKSTPALPFINFNGGLSGQNTVAYTQELADLLANGLRPTDIIIEGMHPNDGGSSFSINATRQALIMAAIRNVQAVDPGARIYLTTGLPNGGYSGAAGTNTAEGARLAMNTWIRNLCATGVATLIDSDSVITDGASPARAKVVGGNSYLQPDNIHPSIYGIQAIEPLVSAALSTP